MLNQTIRLYNEERPHMSIGMLTPQIVHENNLKIEKVWKTYPWKKRNIVNPLQDELRTVNV